MAPGSSAPGPLSARDAADVLGLPVDAVLALAAAGFLSTEDGPDGPRFAPLDLTRFSQRNRPAVTSPASGAGARVLVFPPGGAGRSAVADTEALLHQLTRCAPIMAEQVLALYAETSPEPGAWEPGRRERFVADATARFEAVLALVAAGDAVDDRIHDDIRDELGAIGARAARAGVGLPEVLLTIRLSRDVVVQTALALGREGAADPAEALAPLLSRTLPAVDRLTDAVASGYWRAVLGIRDEITGRYDALVEHATDAIAEIDPDGSIRYANPAFGRMIGRPSHQVVGMQAESLASFAEEGPDFDELLGPDHTDAWQEVRIRRLDGVERLLQVRVHDRHVGPELVGYLGVMRDVTVDRDLARQKDDFLGLLTVELRNPLAVVLGLGVTLETYAGDLDDTRVARVGKAIRHHAERITRLTDDLTDVGHLESHSLLLSPRPVELGRALAAALDILSRHHAAERVEVVGELDTVVHADPRRLEQVLAHLVENALLHGAAPVRCEVLRAADSVEIVVRDHGPGLSADRVEVAFSRLHTSREHPRYRDRPTGLGLSLARGLVEAMGGRLEYHPADGGGACFVVTLLR